VKAFFEKIIKILLFLFLLLIPTQIGKHFWMEWSYVLGIRVDYLSPTLYLLDVIWLGLFLLKGLPVLLNFNFKKIKKYFKFRYFLVVGFIAINVLMAVSPWVAVYKWIRVFQVLITFFYFRKNKKSIKENLVKIIPCWVVFESLLAMAQIAKNGSLNGIFYWFGERSFSFNTIGIAQISVMGRGLIRAYGTFSHPNSLAGFFLVVLLLWYFLKKKVNNYYWWTVFWFGFLGIMVSGSRTIWVLTLGLVLGLAWVKIKNKVNIIGLFLLFFAILVFVLRLVNMEYQVSDFLGGWDVGGISKRMQLNWAGLKMIKESPWFGIGLGNFLVRLPEFQRNSGFYWLQPVHNIFILAWSQIGVLGLILSFLFLARNFVWGKINFIFKIIFLVVLISGTIDHYWLTLPQNIWLLVLVLGIV
jgi:O-antigen ligase